MKEDFASKFMAIVLVCFIIYSLLLLTIKRYGKKCRYAHGKLELRPVSRSNQYKTKTCKAYHEGGSCPYGVRCTFIHHPSDDKLVAGGNENNISQESTTKIPSPVTTTTTATTPKLQMFSNNYKSDFVNNHLSLNTSNGIWDSKLGLSTDYTLSNYKTYLCYQQEFTQYIDNERLKFLQDEIELYANNTTVNSSQNYMYDSNSTSTLE